MMNSLLEKQALFNTNFELYIETGRIVYLNEAFIQFLNISLPLCATFIAVLLVSYKTTGVLMTLLGLSTAIFFLLYSGTLKFWFNNKYTQL